MPVTAAPQDHIRAGSQSQAQTVLDLRDEMKVHGTRPQVRPVCLRVMTIKWQIKKHETHRSMPHCTVNASSGSTKGQRQLGRDHTLASHYTTREGLSTRGIFPRWTIETLGEHSEDIWKIPNTPIDTRGTGSHS